MKIYKVKTGVFWDRLLSESGKHHWLSVDWSKWKDEDESDEEVNFGGHAQNFNDFNVRFFKYAYILLNGLFFSSMEEMRTRKCRISKGSSKSLESFQFEIQTHQDHEFEEIKQLNILSHFLRSKTLTFRHFRRVTFPLHHASPHSFSFSPPFVSLSSPTLPLFAYFFFIFSFSNISSPLLLVPLPHCPPTRTSRPQTRPRPSTPPPSSTAKEWWRANVCLCWLRPHCWYWWRIIFSFILVAWEGIWRKTTPSGKARIGSCELFVREITGRFLSFFVDNIFERVLNLYSPSPPNTR